MLKKIVALKAKRVKGYQIINVLNRMINTKIQGFLIMLGRKVH